MKKIVLDTNFIMSVAELKIDIFTEMKRIANFNYELCIMDKTLDELKGLTEIGSGRQKQAAKIALQLIKQRKISVMQTKKDRNVDNLIIDVVDKHKKEHDYVIATSDKELKRKLKNTPLIIIKQKSHLGILNMDYL